MALLAKPDALDERIARMRRFDRFYERRLGEHRKDDALASALTTTEIGVLRELGGATPQWATPVWLSWRASVDPGYLCRILKRFRKEGIVSVGLFADDRRQREIVLTDRGRRVYRCVESLHSNRTRSLFEGLPERQRQRLVHAMETIEEVLTRDPLDNLFERLAEARREAQTPR